MSVVNSAPAMNRRYEFRFCDSQVLQHHRLLRTHAANGGCWTPTLTVMPEQPDPIDRALVRLWPHRTFRHGDRTMTIACLIRPGDWRPLDAPWWRGKEVCIIGADLDGNFLSSALRLTVRHWDHRLQADTVVVPSLREFVARIEYDG